MMIKILILFGFCCLLIAAVISLSKSFKQIGNINRTKKQSKNEVIEKIKKNLPNKDFADDLGIFVDRGINIMDIKQLAEGQKRKENLNAVFVVAPNFLELSSDEIYNSTKYILGSNKEVEFTYFISRNTVKGFENISKRLARELDVKKNELQKRFKKVVIYSDAFFLSDYTIWNPYDYSAQGFSNIKSDNKTDLCFEMPQSQLKDVINKLREIKLAYESQQNLQLVKSTKLKSA